jgi:hypothetical protein
MGSMEFIWAIIVPMVAVWSLEKYLIKSLFRKYSEDPNSDTKHLKKMDAKIRKFEEIKLSLNDRKEIQPSTLPGLVESLRGFLMKCFKYFRYQDDDYFAMKAAARLAKEMDIKRFIRAIRSSKNSMKFLTTRNERRIIQMQAGESEAFTSDDYHPFLD